MKLITLENLKNFWKDVKSYVDNGLSKKADSVHGTHVNYGTINGKAPGTPSAGTSSKVAREDHVHPVQTTVSGNAGSATKLATARTINGTSFDGSANITTANWGTARNIQIGNTAKSVNGSANVTWSLSEIGAAASNHTHSYLPLSGGTLTGSIKFSGGGYNNHAIRMEAGDANGAFIGIGAGGLTVIGSGESMSVVRDNITNGSDETMIVASDQTIRFLTGVQNGYSSAKEVSINTSGVINAPQGMTGNASTATKLQTARTINGTSFDGSGNITTANWGTARNIQIGNTSKSVNGSGNVSWSLSEIGAAPTGYGLGTTCQDKSNQDCNNILVTGFYMGSNMTNKPSGCTQGWIYLLVMRHNDSWVRQVAYDFGTASQVYTRVKQNGSWTAWVATDTNTWRGVQDNLTSTATDQSLSANQGKVLKGLIDGKAASNHTHGLVNLNSEAFGGGNDLNTYNSTKTWVARTLNSTTNKPGDYFTVVNFGANSNSNFQLAHSYANNSILYVRGRHDTSGNYTPWAKIYTDKNKPTASEIGAAAASHTHNYAGSSSAGGNANAAVKLATARSINGTNFDGTGNITTANWGTARNLQIGNTAKSVNGSANVTWTLSEIGAAAASHTHAYAPTATGSSISIHADSDSSSTSEYLLLKAGHNELKIASSAGGTTVTKGQDKLTFNGNIVYHAGRKPTISEIGAAASNHTHSYLPLSGGTIGGDLIASTLKSLGDTMVDGRLWMGDFSREQNGYTKLPNGLIMQWGTAEGRIGDFITVTLPIAFPNKTLICGATVSYNLTSEFGNMHLQATWASCTRWGNNVQVIFGGTSPTKDILQGDWFAIGY